MSDREVEVFAEITGEPVAVGQLWSHRKGNRESATFSYHADYLARSDAYAIDPGLSLVAGPQQTPEGQAMFGAFSDCAPDRWGRKLMDRDEARRAKQVDETARSFGEADYLLNVDDHTRHGALRFFDADQNAFVAGKGQGVPRLVELPRLLAQSDRAERDMPDDDDIADLIRAGSSLGGARPKASVMLPSGELAIAKFPSPSNDTWDVMRWEAIALDLARKAGIVVADYELIEVAGQSVLITHRFDRSRTSRVGYVSAMTMLEAEDREQRSYLEIAEALAEESENARRDLHELWRRIAFSILISNTDDHLRNHGFLRRSTSGWALSPAFDLNPNPRPGTKHLSTAIDFSTTEARIEVLMGVHDYFDLNVEDARAIVADVASAVGDWKTTAAARELDTAAIQVMSPAFEHEEANRVANELHT